MRLRSMSSLLVTLACSSVAYAQEAPIVEFSERVTEYAQLRDGLTPRSAFLRGAEGPAELDAAQQELIRRIREARAVAMPGDILTPNFAHEFTARIRGRLDGGTWAAVMDDNPGEFPCIVNAEYPEDMPRATMPANLLAELPQLPEGLQYRFVGRHLILHDVHANLIVDYVPYVLAPCDCDGKGLTREE